MGAPKGLGLWIVSVGRASVQLGTWRNGGPVLPDLFAEVKRAGATWLAVKSGDDDDNRNVTQAFVDGAHNAGIGVYTWNYCVPGAADTARQISQIRLEYSKGVDGHILDAEIEWELRGDRRPEAAAFVRVLRSLIGPDAWLAHAPWPIVSAHPAFPFVELGEATQAQMDQAYWTMQNGSAASFLDRADRNWAQLAKDHPTAVSWRMPIGAIFDGHQPGRQTGQTPTPTDVALFLDRYGPTCSLYTIDVCPRVVWEYLCTRAAVMAPPTTPAPPPPMPGPVAVDVTPDLPNTPDDPNGGDKP